MRIRRLELCGFKSFCERTVFQFADGISGVVGPNGCGKSNVLDAIRWLLGESNPRLLRGQGMEDVIFSGSKARPATGVAEATLVFDNRDGSLGGKYARFSEIEVSRRLYRDGESQYLINRTRCRRKDIVDLFLDSGVGARASSVIEQGKVTDLINSKPEERRALIEEAAGIVGYKARRQEAQRRLEATEQNLLRVGDRVDELRRRMNALKRQAHKANRYRRLRAFRKESELLIALARTREITVTYREWIDQQADLEGRCTRLREELTTRQVSLEAQREQLRYAEAAVDELKEKQALARADVQTRDRQREYAEQEIRRLERQVEELDAEVGSAHGRAEALAGEEQALLDEERAIGAEVESRRGEHDERQDELDRCAAELDAVQRQLEELKRSDMAAVEASVRLGSRIEGLEATRDDLRVRGDVLGQEADELRRRLAESQQREAEVEVRVREQEAELVAARGTLSELEEELESRNQAWAETMATVADLGDLIRERAARRRSLDDVLARFEGFDRAVREVMKLRQRDGARSGILGTVADVITAPEALEQAVEAALGRAVEYVLVEGLEHGRGALAYLREEGGGRTSFVPLDGVRPVLAAEPAGGPGVIGRLIDRVAVETEHRAVAELLLGDVILVEDLDTAVRLYERACARERFVTLDGTAVDAGGVVTGGQAAEGGVLGQKRELRQLEAELGDLQREEAVARASAEAISSAIEERTARQREVAAALQRGEIDRARLEGDLHAAHQQVRTATRRCEEVDRERDGLQARLDAIDGDLETARREAEQAGARHRAVQERVAEAEVAARAQRERRQRLQERAFQAELEATAAAGRLQGVRDRLEQIARTRGEVRERIERGRSQRSEARQRGEALARQVEELHEAAQASARQLEEFGAMVHEAVERRTAIAAERARLDGALDGLRGDVSRAEQQLQQARTQVAVLDERLGHLRDELRRDFDLDLREVFATIEAEGEVEVALRGALPRPLGDDDEDETEDGPGGGGERVPASSGPAEAMGIHVTFQWAQLLDEAALLRRREELERTRRDLERIGEINAAAPEEYEEVKTQHDDLGTQMRDLQDSMNQIRQAIVKLNRTSRERFAEAFEQVDRQFRELYPRLTGGGGAELALTDPDDLLETGVEVRVQPPGKKLTAMGLLSGGEKAMAALSLVFSVFLYRPSPFCLLDEVDAELDEANVRRFSGLLREMSARTQFIVISHTRKTMEVADVLFGVTMEKPGISKLVTVKLDEVAA